MYNPPDRTDAAALATIDEMPTALSPEEASIFYTSSNDNSTASGVASGVGIVVGTVITVGLYYLIWRGIKSVAKES